MTPESKDIIGIVKKLQRLAGNCTDKDGYWVINHKDNDAYTDGLHEHFPSIAQALTITVEALEGDRTTFNAMKRAVKVLVDNEVGVDGRAIIQDCENAILQLEKALSRIHSL